MVANGFCLDGEAKWQSGFSGLDTFNEIMQTRLKQWRSRLLVVYQRVLLLLRHANIS